MIPFRKLLTFLLCLVFPTRLTFWLLNLVGHNVDSKSKIGFSVIWINGVLKLKRSSRIGNFNVITASSIFIDESGYIGNFNNLKGPFEIQLDKLAALGNSNRCYRPPQGVSYGHAVLKLGELSKITSRHRIDCTRSILIGDFSTIAGHDSQLWTHAYYHDRTGPGRFRLDGPIVIGNNVNIGSGTIINCGIKISDGVVVGSNSTISKSLQKPGTYVSQSLRFIEMNEDQRLRFKRVEGFIICDEVYERMG